MRFFFILVMVPLWMLLAGCGDPGVSRGEPFYRRGMNLEAAGNHSGAIQAYLTCIGRQPDHAAACCRLASLSDLQTKDGAELAIHYYRRYLELDPRGKEARTVRQRLAVIEQEMLEKLAAAYPNTTPKAWDRRLASSYVPKEEAARLRQQNDSLRADNADLRRRNEAFARKPAPEEPENARPQPIKEPVAAKETEDPVAPTAILTGVLRFHIVLHNDNLSSISRKYYGTVRHWRLILERNKELLRGSEKNLQPGMRLEIPPLEEKPAAIPEPVG